ncbi:MAG: ThiF family adenylyltransferase [Promethearchaeota archaeon]|jgi:molybdopterin/thiamine biosynthesis adenylyltransferase
MESNAFHEVRNLKIFIFPSFKNQFDDLKDKQGSYSLYGRVYDDYNVCHFVGISSHEIHTHKIGILTIGNKKPEIPSLQHEFPFLDVKSNPQNIMDLEIKIHDSEDQINNDLTVNIEQINLNRLFIRIDEAETPLKILKEKRVVIIGMGSGGSLIRHICDLNQLGRFKTKAVMDYIKIRTPDVSIKTVEKKFSLHTQVDAEFYLGLFSKVDLIVAASGEHPVNFALNDFIHSNNLPIPIIYAGTFDRVKGALMFKVDPRIKDYCYHCIYSDPTDNGNIQTGSIPATIELEQKIEYDRTLQEQIAQPGLGLDIDNLTILLSKFCLDTLLTGHEHGLYKFPHNFYMWFNRTINLSSVKFEGLELYFYEDLEKNSNCPFHGPELIGNNMSED